MVNSDFWVLLAMLIYFMVVVVIGFVYSKKSNQSTENYFLGGRGLGPWLTALSAEASDMSGWLLMGLPGVAYFTGASNAMWTAIGLAIGTYLNWLLVAKRLRKYSQVANNSITLPDFFSNRFHDRNRILMTISAVIIVVFFSIYVGSCFVTCGKLFETLFGLNYAAMMILGAVIVFLYTFVGGFLSVSTTDLIQGMIMVFALVIVFVGSVVSIGGIDNTVEFLRSIPGFLSATQTATPVLDSSGLQVLQDGLPQFAQASSFGWIAIISGLSWGLGYFGMPQVLVRFMSATHSNDLRLSRRIATVWVVVSLASALCIGLIGRALLPGAFTSQSAAENIFVVLSTMMLPSFICGLVVSGIFASSMSSSSSYLLISGSAIAENIYRRLLKKNATDAQVMIVARLTLVAVFAFGVIIALDANSSIFQVVSYAWAGFGASFGPLILASLYWRRANLAGAVSGMIAGALSVFIWHTFLAPLGGIWGIYELLPAFIIALATTIVVSLATKAPHDAITAEFDSYMDADC